VGEVDQLDDAVHHRVAQGDQRVDRAEGQRIEELLGQDGNVNRATFS
jgi:hypothetical protein